MFTRKSSASSIESIHALNDAQDRLETTKNRSQEVNKVASALRIMREHNHFAERLRNAIGGHIYEP